MFKFHLIPRIGGAVLALAAASQSQAFYSFNLTAQAGIFFNPLIFQNVNQDNGLTRVTNDLVNVAPPFMSEAKYDVTFGEVHAGMKAIKSYSNAFLQSDLTDQLHVFSESGGPVTLRFDLPTHGTVHTLGSVINAYAQAVLSVDNAAGTTYTDGFIGGTYQHTDSVAFERTYANGATVTLRHIFKLQANPFAPDSEIDLDYTNTGRATVEVLTPGGSIRSDSGATYSSTPEPATLAGVSILLIGLRKRRRR